MELIIRQNRQEAVLPEVIDSKAVICSPYNIVYSFKPFQILGIQTGLELFPQNGYNIIVHQYTDMIDGGWDVVNVGTYHKRDEGEEFVVFVRNNTDRDEYIPGGKQLCTLTLEPNKNELTNIVFV